MLLVGLVRGGLLEMEALAGDLLVKIGKPLSEALSESDGDLQYVSERHHNGVHIG